MNSYRYLLNQTTGFQYLKKISQKSFSANQHGLDQIALNVLGKVEYTQAKISLKKIALNY